MDRDIFLKYFNYKVNLREINIELLEGQFKVIEIHEVLENRRILRSFLSDSVTRGYLIILSVLVSFLIIRSVTHEEIQSGSIIPYAIIVILGYFSIYALNFLKNYEYSNLQYTTQKKLREKYERIPIYSDNPTLIIEENVRSGFDLPLRKKRVNPKIEKWNLYDPDWDLLDFILNIFPWDLLRVVVFVFYISIAITLFRQPSDSLFQSFGEIVGVLILLISGIFCLVILVSFIIELKFVFQKIFNYHYIKNKLYDLYTDQLELIEVEFETCIAEYNDGLTTYDEFKQFQTDYIQVRTLFTQYKTTLSELPFLPNRSYNLWIIFGSPIIAFLFSIFQPIVSKWLGVLIPF